VKTICLQVDPFEENVGPGAQHWNGEGFVCDIGLPLQHGTQLGSPGVQDPQLMRLNPTPPGAGTFVQLDVLQQPEPQFAVPGEQPGAHPV
jgi:hypothetical protein